MGMCIVCYNYLRQPFHQTHSIRFCICNILAAAFLFSINAFSTAFSVLMIITFQSVIQLQIIRGKMEQLWKNHPLYWSKCSIGIIMYTGLYHDTCSAKSFRRIVVRLYNYMYRMQWRIQEIGKGFQRPRTIILK